MIVSLEHYLLQPALSTNGTSSLCQLEVLQVRRAGWWTLLEGKPLPIVFGTSAQKQIRYFQVQEAYLRNADHYVLDMAYRMGPWNITRALSEHSHSNQASADMLTHYPMKPPNASSPTRPITMQCLTLTCRTFSMFGLSVRSVNRCLICLVENYRQKSRKYVKWQDGTLLDTRIRMENGLKRGCE